MRAGAPSPSDRARGGARRLTQSHFEFLTQGAYPLPE